MKIFKYAIPMEEKFTLELPIHSKILSFQIQNEQPFIWVLVDPDKNLRPRYFTLVGTGYEFDHHPDTMKYIGTIQMANGALIWHLFEDIF